MPLKRKITLALYILSILVYSLFRLQGKSTSALVVQPLILITLSIFYFFSTSKLNYFFLLGLLFSLLASLFFLDFTLEKFMLGLGLSFIANQFFLLIIVHRMNILKFKDVFLIALPIYLLLLLLVYLYYEVSTTAKVVVLIYAFSVALLLAFALLHFRNSQNKIAMFMLAGTVLMAVRDFFTGFSRLLQLDDYFYFLPAMLSHAVAMYLICKSIILEDNKVSESSF